MRKTQLFVALATALVVGLAPMASAAHSVTIVSDSPEGEAYTMEVDVKSFDLVPFQNRDAEPGEGHIHYLANGEDACSANKADCEAATDYATPDTEFTYTNLEPGDDLQAELVLSDHQPSGTDSEGNPDGSRVLSESVEVQGNAPGPGVAVMLALIALAGLVAHRRT